MVYNEKQDVRGRQTSSLLLFCLPLALVVNSNGRALDKGVSKRGSRQDLPIDERLEAERRLSELGYWTGPVDGNLDAGSRHALIASHDHMTSYSDRSKAGGA